MPAVREVGCWSERCYAPEARPRESVHRPGPGPSTGLSGAPGRRRAAGCEASKGFATQLSKGLAGCRPPPCGALSTWMWRSPAGATAAGSAMAVAAGSLADARPLLAEPPASPTLLSSVGSLLASMAAVRTERRLRQGNPSPSCATSPSRHSGDEGTQVCTCWVAGRWPVGKIGAVSPTALVGCASCWDTCLRKTAGPEARSKWGAD